MKQIKVYVAGKVLPNSSLGGSFWRNDFCNQLQEKTGIKIINLDPTSWVDSEEAYEIKYDPEMGFGRDSFFIKNCDLVIVNLTDDVSVGASQEMLIAKYFNKPLLGIAKKEGKFIKSEQHMLGKKIIDYIHSFVFVLCDVIVNDVDEAAIWIKNSFEKIKPKGIECIDKSVEYYIKNYLDKDAFAKEYGL